MHCDLQVKVAVMMSLNQYQAGVATSFRVTTIQAAGDQLQKYESRPSLQLSVQILHTGCSSSGFLSELKANETLGVNTKKEKLPNSPF